MRNLIALAEGAINWLTVPAEQMVQYVHSWDHRQELGDGDGSTSMTSKDIGKAQARFSAMTAAGSLTIYRCMIVNPRSLDPGAGLGVCWTLDRRYANAYNAQGSSRDALVFTAEIDPSAVDWIATIALVPGNEDEIRLKQNAPLVVSEIVDVYGDHVREDVYGDTFYAGGAV